MGGGSNELCIFLLGDSMNVILQVKNKTDGTNRKFEAWYFVKGDFHRILSPEPSELFSSG